MFEKEAEERARKLEESQTLGIYDNDEDLARDSGWNDGEVCGYEEGFKDGAEFGYNKANEWHYVKDKLPEEDVYVYLFRNGVDFPVVARRHIFYGKTEWEWDCKWGSGFQLKADNEKIIAWKEIVLPELKENDIKRELFPEITLPEGSAELVDKVIADAEKRLKESE